MKKIAILIFILSSFMLISCSDDGSGDKEKGYVDPGDWTEKVVKANKAYSFANYPDNSGEDCLAIIYQNTLGEDNFLGIAIKETGFDLKIYCSGYTSIPSGENTLSPCTVIINGVKTNDVAINISITNNGNDTHTIEFKGNVTGTDIQNGDSITAVKYP